MIQNTDAIKTCDGQILSAEHFTCLPKSGVGTLSSVTINHERPPMSCLQQLDTLKANSWTMMYNGATIAKV